MVNESSQNQITIYGKLEYISQDIDGNIIIGISKKTQKEQIIQLLKEIEGSEVYILIEKGRWE